LGEAEETSKFLPLRCRLWAYSLVFKTGHDLEKRVPVFPATSAKRLRGDRAQA
jgi:hypothetical protein